MRSTVMLYRLVFITACGLFWVGIGCSQESSDGTLASTHSEQAVASSPQEVQVEILVKDSAEMAAMPPMDVPALATGQVVAGAAACATPAVAPVAGVAAVAPVPAVAPVVPVIPGVGPFGFAAPVIPTAVGPWSPYFFIWGGGDDDFGVYEDDGFNDEGDDDGNNDDGGNNDDNDSNHDHGRRNNNDDRLRK